MCVTIWEIRRSSVCCQIVLIHCLSYVNIVYLNNVRFYHIFYCAGCGTLCIKGTVYKGFWQDLELRSKLRVMILPVNCFVTFLFLIILWFKPLPYRNLSIDLLCKSMVRFLYKDHRHKRGNYNKVSGCYRCNVILNTLLLDLF